MTGVLPIDGGAADILFRDVMKSDLILSLRSSQQALGIDQIPLGHHSPYHESHPIAPFPMMRRSSIEASLHVVPAARRHRAGVTRRRGEAASGRRARRHQAGATRIQEASSGAWGRILLGSGAPCGACAWGNIAALSAGSQHVSWHQA